MNNINQSVIDKSNKMMWAVVAITIIGDILAVIFTVATRSFKIPLMIFIIMYISRIVLVILDHGDLKRNNIAICSFWWFLFLPVYLWQRNTILNKSQVDFWIFVSWVVSSNIISKSIF